MKHKFLFPCLAIALSMAMLAGCKPKDGANGGTAAGEAPAWVPVKQIEWFDAGIDTGGTRPESTGAGNTQDGDTIKIGMIASLSGSEKPWGDESKRGAQLAVDMVNEAGGINGKKIELLVEDSAGLPATGKTATERLVSSKHVLAMLGEVASGVTGPSAEVCQGAGVPIISIGSTRTDLSNTGNMFFRVCYTDAFQGAMLAKFAYEDLKLKNVAILTDKQLPYSVGLSNDFRTYFEKLGGKIIAEDFYEKGTTDFKGQLTNLKAEKPDGLFCSGYFTEIGPIARQKAAVGLEGPMFGGDGWDSSELLTAGGDGIMGCYYSNHYSNLEERPEVQDFVTKFKDKYGAEPANAMGALGYDAALVLIDALKRASSMDSKSIRDAIATTKGLAAVSGTITMGPDGNAQKPGLILQAKMYDASTQ
jgi:branched-chain amino acid transport system substrate-binding protein